MLIIKKNFLKVEAKENYGIGLGLANYSLQASNSLLLIF